MVGASLTAVAALAVWTYVVLSARGSTTTIVSMTPPPPTVVVTTTPEHPPPAPPPAPVPEVGCPAAMPTAGEVAIGCAVHRDDLLRDPSEMGEPSMRVVAAGAAPVIALLRHDSTVWISDDDGAHFARVFADREVVQIAIADDGTLYALAGEHDLGVRTPDGHTRWRGNHRVSCETINCTDRLGLLGERVVWFHDHDIIVSRDRGKSWRSLEIDSSWQQYSDTDVFSWRGAVYAIDHFTEMCGIDDTPVSRFDGTHAAYDIFHNYDGPSRPTLEPSDDVATTWTWQTRCLPSHDSDDDGEVVHRVPCKIPAKRLAMLTAATLRPRTGGGRDLAVHSGSLIELCDRGARQVYREFPFPRVDATDARGRPLVVDRNQLLRWSAVHGWRRLYQLQRRD